MLYDLQSGRFRKRSYLEQFLGMVVLAVPEASFLPQLFQLSNSVSELSARVLGQAIRIHRQTPSIDYRLQRIRRQFQGVPLYFWLLTRFYQDRNLALQQDALTKAFDEKIFSGTASGSKANRPGLAEALSHLRGGDVLVVWKLDRLGRSLKQLIEVAKDLEERGIGLESLQKQIDTTAPGGNIQQQNRAECEKTTSGKSETNRSARTARG